MLTRHNPEEALKYFHQALDLCPSNRKEGITRILFYTGVTLQKLGYGGCAVRSWNAAARIQKSGLCRKMLERLTNSYGMSLGTQGENPDFRAFFIIQQSRYLVSRRQRKFGSQAEKDMVMDIIQASWDELSGALDFENLTVDEKVRLFHQELIIFPYLECPDEWETDTIPFDFRRNQRVYRDSPCLCGSGMPYGNCCGRILSEDELEFGLF